MAEQTPSVADRLGLLSGAEGIISGTVVCAAVIAAGAGHTTSIAQLILSIIGTVIVYFLAHVHAHALAGMVKNPEAPRKSVNYAIAHSVPYAVASLLPVAVLLIAALFGAEISTAAVIALAATTVLLAGYSYIAGQRIGLGLTGRLLSAAAGGLIGILIMALKLSLH